MKKLQKCFGNHYVPSNCDKIACDKVYQIRRKEEKVQKMEYKRKVDKGRIPTCNIMGVNIAAINMEWLVQYLKKKSFRNKRGLYLCLKCTYHGNQL